MNFAIATIEFYCTLFFFCWCDYTPLFLMCNRHWRLFYHATADGVAAAAAVDRCAIVYYLCAWADIASTRECGVLVRMAVWIIIRNLLKCSFAYDSFFRYGLICFSQYEALAHSFYGLLLFPIFRVLFACFLAFFLFIFNIRFNFLFACCLRIAEANNNNRSIGTGHSIPIELTSPSIKVIQ